MIAHRLFGDDLAEHLVSSPLGVEVDLFVDPTSSGLVWGHPGDVKNGIVTPIPYYELFKSLLDNTSPEDDREIFFDVKGWQYEPGRGEFMEPKEIKLLITSLSFMMDRVLREERPKLRFIVGCQHPLFFKEESSFGKLGYRVDPRAMLYSTTMQGLGPVAKEFGAKSFHVCVNDLSVPRDELVQRAVDLAKKGLPLGSVFVPTEDIVVEREIVLALAERFESFSIMTNHPAEMQAALSA